MVTAVSPSFCAASTTLAPPPRSSSILSRRSATLVRARSIAISLLHVAGDARVVRLDARLDLADLDQRDAEPALHRLADLARRQREGGVRDGGIENGGLGDEAEIDVGGAELALLGEVVERRARRRCGCARPALPPRSGTRSAETWRFSGVPSWSLRCSNSFFASSSETSVHLPISSGVIATKAILRYSGARNWALCSSK